jgi:predicted GNAT family N-acyltransferase
MEIRDVAGFADLEVAFYIRQVVFVMEQHCPVQDEFDQFDATASHILAYDGDQPVGTARWRVVDGIAKFERICVLASHRKHGVGKLLVQALEARARRKGLAAAKLHGQVQAAGFYHKLGYVSSGDVFIEDGIEHVLMTKNL